MFNNNIVKSKRMNRALIALRDAGWADVPSFYREEERYFDTNENVAGIAYIDDEAGIEVSVIVRENGLIEYYGDTDHRVFDSRIAYTPLLIADIYAL